jgi:hypothetical protein
MGIAWTITADSKMMAAKKAEIKICGHILKKYFTIPFSCKFNLILMLNVFALHLRQYCPQIKNCQSIFPAITMNIQPISDTD